MNILFVHQNMPGQYRELVQWLAATGQHRIFFLTQRQNAPKIPGVETCIYKTHHTPKKDAYGLSKVWEECAGSGFGAAGEGYFRLSAFNSLENTQEAVARIKKAFA